MDTSMMKQTTRNLILVNTYIRVSRFKIKYAMSKNPQIIQVTQTRLVARQDCLSTVKNCGDINAA